MFFFVVFFSLSGMDFLVLLDILAFLVFLVFLDFLDILAFLVFSRYNLLAELI